MRLHPALHTTPRSRSVRRPPRALLTALVLVAACSGGATGTAPATSPSSATAGTGGETSSPVPEPTVPPLHPSVDDYPTGRVVVDPGDGAAPVPVAVLVADDPDRRSHGLMEVEEVPDGVGMLFTYDEDHEGAFWMKDTLTDLDIAWVDDTGRIVGIATMEPCTADPCERYDPGAPYRQALEVRAGWLEDNDVEVGDRVLVDRRVDEKA